MSGPIVQGPVTTIAFCWRIDRRDGGGVALTSHDAALEIDGIRFDPAPGMSPAAITAELGLAGRTSEIAGSLTSAAISEADLQAGRWDGATLNLFAIDWERPEGTRIDLLQGELGQVEQMGAAFGVDLLGVAAKLERPVCPTTSPECRAELGDRRCRVDMAGRRQRAVVISTDGPSITLDRSIEERFRYGSIRVVGGPGSGKRSVIVGVDGASIILRHAIEEALLAGTPVEIAEGCDKRLATCADRFRNAVNFRGEPHLPGNDLLTRYPGE